MHLQDIADFLQLQDLGLRDYHCGLRITERIQGVCGTSAVRSGSPSILIRRLSAVRSGSPSILVVLAANPMVSSTQ